MPYSQIPNAMLQDCNLSMKAKGLLSFLLSLPPDWVIYKSTLPSYFSDGYSAISSAWDELVDAGYILSVQMIGDGHKFQGWNHIVYYEPQITKVNTNDNVIPELGSSDLDNADFGKSQIGEPQTTNTEYTNKHKTKKQYTKKESISGVGKRNIVYPTKEQMVMYFEESGYRADIAEKVYHYYADNDWIDSRGNKVKSWKQKVSSVWFKPENEKPKSNGYEKLLGYDARLHNNPAFRFRISPTGNAISYDRI